MSQEALEPEEGRHWKLASYGASALQTYYDETRGSGYGETYGDEGSGLMEETLTDLLADLHHLADRAGLDWEDITERAELHYSAEIAGE